MKLKPTAHASVCLCGMTFWVRQHLSPESKGRLVIPRLEEGRKKETSARQTKTVTCLLLSSPLRLFLFFSYRKLETSIWLLQQRIGLNSTQLIAVAPSSDGPTNLKESPKKGPNVPPPTDTGTHRSSKGHEWESTNYAWFTVHVLFLFILLNSFTTYWTRCNQ